MFYICTYNFLLFRHIKRVSILNTGDKLETVQGKILAYHSNLGVEMHEVTPFRVANTPTLITPLRVHFRDLFTSMNSSITCE